MWLLCFLGCFAPTEGNWAFYDVSQAGDCEVDQGTSFEESIEIRIAGGGFSLETEQASLSCSLTGQDFDCSSSSVALDREEVQLTADIEASGSFEDSDTGELIFIERWSCSSGECDTYDLNSCELKKQGSLVRIE